MGLSFTASTTTDPVMDMQRVRLGSNAGRPLRYEADLEKKVSLELIKGGEI